MKFEFLSSYVRTFKKLPINKQLKAVRAIIVLVDFFKIGQKPKGLGLKKLRNNYWEIRVDLEYRIIFEIEKNLISFVFVGNHGSIKNFLKQ